MKFKGIILIMLLLLIILTIGAVSASENATSDDLAVEDDNVIEMIEEDNSGEEMLLTSDAGNDVVSGVGNGTSGNGTSAGKDPTLEVTANEGSLSEDVNVFININSDATGTINLTVDGMTYNANVIDGYCSFLLSGLDVGSYMAVISYSGDGVYNSKIAMFPFNVLPYINLNGGSLQQVADAIQNNRENVTIYLQGGHYADSTGVVRNGTIKNVLIHGGTITNDSMMATFENTNFALAFQGTNFVNVTFKNIKCEGRLFNVNGASFTDCQFINCESIGAVDGGTFMSTGTNFYNVTFENFTAPDGRLFNFMKGSMIGCQFINCESYLQFIAWGADTGGAPSSGDPIPGSPMWDGTPFIVRYCNFTNCRQTYDGFEDGHGQFAAATGVLIDGCNFINTSSGQHGGAICISDTTPWVPNYIASTIVNTNFIGIKSKWFAIYIHGQMASAPYSSLIGYNVVENCTFINCNASENYGACIGISHDDVIVKNCYFINNTAGQGTAIMIGGITNDDGHIGSYAFSGDNSKSNNITIFNCTFVDCVASSYDCPWVDYQGSHSERSTGYGSAIYAVSNYTNIIGCTFENNVATEGGAIYINGINNVVMNSLFANNYASNGNGGAIYSLEENGVSIHNSVFRDNSATLNGGAFYNCDYEDCIFEGNSFPETYPPEEILNVTVENNFYNQTSRIIVSLPSNATGNVVFTLFAKGGFNNSVSKSLVDGVAICEISNLSVNLYNVSVHYLGDSIFEECWKNATFRVLPIINITQKVIAGENGLITMEFGNVDGDFVDIFIDGKRYGSQIIDNGELIYGFSTNKIPAGNHTITFRYDGEIIDENIFNYWDEASSTYKQMEFAFEILAKDVVIDPEPDEKLEYCEAYVYDTEGNIATDAKGTIEFFVNGVSVAVVEVVNGIARLEISNYKNGKYIISWVYSGDEKYENATGESIIEINRVPVRIVAADLSIVYTSAKLYSVTVYGVNGKIAKSVSVTFLINNKAYKTVKTNANGVASVAISNAPGSYKIAIKALGTAMTKKLTVKHALSLKTVKVKKSAKKLVIKATLKVDGKASKGKKITLKFNGKKIKAKTNKKGVAKFTVKSNVLKKLKVGKKVKYQATYLKDTVKKSVKVKK